MRRSYAFVAAWACMAAQAHAWEIRLERLDARLKELRAAWKGKEPEAIQADMLERAKQAKPSWVERVERSIQGGGNNIRNVALRLTAGKAETSWKEGKDGRRAYFAVGVASGLKRGGLSLRAAETRAFSDLRKALGAPGCVPRSAVASLRPMVQAASGDQGVYEIRTNLPKGRDCGVYTPIDWYADEAADAFWVLLHSAGAGR